VPTYRRTGRRSGQQRSPRCSCRARLRLSPVQAGHRSREAPRAGHCARAQHAPLRDRSPDRGRQRIWCWAHLGARTDSGTRSQPRSRIALGVGVRAAATIGHSGQRGRASAARPPRSTPGHLS
jgi:hypothetical protein